MAQQTQTSQRRSTKGNPAGKRMSNQALKLRRARSRARGEARTQQRKTEQAAAARFNRDLRAERDRLLDEGDFAGAAELVTPWEAAVARRKKVRLARFGGRVWVTEPPDGEAS